jgi:hypothetical protein
MATKQLATVDRARLHADVNGVLDRGHPELDRHHPQLLDRSRPAHPAVAHVADRLLIPFESGRIEGVLEHGGRTVNVLGGGGDEAVELADFVTPQLT